MRGAIIGDIAGSAYEFNTVKSKDIELFPEEAEFTDDTVLTIAVADAILHNNPYRKSILHWARKYPNESYGSRFREFLGSDNPKPYNSYGNGSAMRVSPVGWAFESEAEVLEHARLSAKVSHNHPEGIKGAQAVALAIFLARRGASKDEIRERISNEFGYNLRRMLDEIRPTYTFDETCQGTVPEAIISFLESTGYEDAIRNAISLGGDADTLAAITGSIAEAFYGAVPGNLLAEGLDRLDVEIIELIEEFLLRFGE
ncbi:MAG: ADP-ribosylglycohydrolase family protein [bacterium]